MLTNVISPACSCTPLNLSNNVTDVLCNGSATGAIDLVTSGTSLACNYIWNDGATTEDRSALTAGVYTVSVSANNSCPTSSTITITQPSTVVTVTGRSTNVSCFGGSNGSINITASGGVGSYTYD